MEALQYELRGFNILIKNLEPASIKSEFVNNIQFVSNSDYDHYANKVQHNMIASDKNAPIPDVVAKVAFKAITDNRDKLRYPATYLAKSAFFFRWLLPLKIFNKMVAKPLERELQ
ncbi:hypothetical protein SIO70_29685 [Chitinophaga sancti]|uniref:hypothetical protein n=1 Tax=Chitinophaga sancti TaxID=1004 RepID=UPI002A74763A|nr:hypothetical protein [Chitinophaga sancti]WPQ62536.1 hypothetical protein SIO70_29685 [Chitinophaga sancti]